MKNKLKISLMILTAIIVVLEVYSITSLSKTKSDMKRKIKIIEAENSKKEKNINDLDNQIKKEDVELIEKEPPCILYHGTGEKYVTSIDQNGLIPKSRLYVHLSKDVETAKAVGKRHGKEVVYSINSEQMYKDGYKFYLSKNGVWLTKRVPVKYVMKEV